MKRLLSAAAVAAAVAYCWGAAGLRPFTAPMDVAVAIPEAMVALLVGVSWRRRLTKSQIAADPPRRDVVPWVVLIGILAILEGVDYISSPRDAHPTLSYIAGELMSSHPGRAALIAFWLFLGWAMFVRSPAESRKTP